MCSLDSELPLEAGLEIEEIEKRLVTTSKRYDFAARTIAYYLLEVEERNLYKKRGFSSIYDFADKLIEMNRRTTQSLLTIVRRLEALPAIAAVFDSGEIGWTKVREIVKVATPESEQEWLDKVRRLSCRELEKAVRRKSPSSVASPRFRSPCLKKCPKTRPLATGERPRTSRMFPWKPGLRFSKGMVIDASFPVARCGPSWGFITLCFVAKVGATSRKICWFFAIVTTR
jgi:hypothetical protein